MGETRNSIWVLEDDRGLQFIYEETLGSLYDLRFLGRLEELEALSLHDRPDLLLADLRLPDGSFLRFLQDDRARARLVYPFIVITSDDDFEALRLCFALGATDYLVKPFSKNELVVKVERGLITRAASTCGATIDPSSLTVARAGQVASLTAKEFQIVSTLYEAMPRPVPREQIIARVWGTIRVAAKTFDVHLFMVRKKLASIGLFVALVPPSAYTLGTEALGEGLAKKS